jgi:hypothetical protein
MPQAIRTKGGVLVRLDDVPGLRLDEIAKRHEGIGWFDVLRTPFRDFAVALDVVRLAYELAGEEPPDDLDNWNSKQAFESLELVGDDLPSSFEDGLPKEVAETETTS